MLLVIGPGGGLNWVATQTMVRHNWQAFLKRRNADTGGAPASSNFGSPYLWETFVCGGRCGGRILPIDIADVDHIAPKSLFTWVFTTNQNPSFQTQNGSNWMISNNGSIHAINYNTLNECDLYYMYKDNNTITIQLDSSRKKDYRIKDILTNNIDNLQLLCPPCNRSKGAIV